MENLCTLQTLEDTGIYFSELCRATLHLIILSKLVENGSWLIKELWLISNLRPRMIYQFKAVFLFLQKDCISELLHQQHIQSKLFLSRVVDCPLSLVCNRESGSIVNPYYMAMGITWRWTGLEGDYKQVLYSTTYRPGLEVTYSRI